MTKTKVSTIAIVVLSVLLAAALAATIVLAAFAFTRSAATTLTFGNGVSLTVTGITNTTWDSKTINSSGAIGGTPSSLTNLTTGVTLDKITVTNTSGSPVRVAVAVVITSTSTQPALFVDASTMSKSTALSGTNWAAEGKETTGFKATPKGGSELDFESFKLANASPKDIVNYIHTVFAAADIAALTGGESFTAKVYIAAVLEASSDVETVNGLKAAIADGTFTAGA